MANNIDEYGIHIDDYSTTLNNLITTFKNIYGDNINIEQNSPDGQWLNNLALQKQDVLNFIVQVYNGMDVDTVIGEQQDILYKLNGLFRKASSYSYVEIAVTTNGACNLNGLDNNVLSPNATSYTVSDNNGTQWYLVNSVSLAENTTTILNFRASNTGAAEALPNTINIMQTIVAGVASVNNPSIQYLTGNTAESYADFRLRRNRSVAVASQGFEDGLRSQLESLGGVIFANVFQNRTNTTDGNGIPPHSIWCIVEGGEAKDIGRTIYNNLTDGCGMKGSVSVNITKINGQIETIFYDVPTFENLHVKANLTNLSGETLDLTNIKNQMVQKITFNVYEAANSSVINSIMLNILEKTAVAYSIEVSNDGTNWTEYLLPSAVNNKFTLDTSNITLTVVA